MTKLAGNIGLMYATHVLKMVMPLLLFPIIARSISVSEFGIFSFYQTVSLICSCIVEYGFGFTAVSAVAAASDVRKERVVVSQTENSKIFLSILIMVSVVVYMTCTGDKFMLIAVISGCIAGLTPNYYYQGKEIFRAVVKAEFFGILFYYTFSITCMILGAAYWWLLISFLIGKCITFSLMSEHYKLITFRLNFRAAIKHLRKNSVFFAHRSSIVVHSSLALLMIDFYMSPADVGLFSAAEKIVMVGCGFIYPLQQVLLPYLSNNRITRKISFLICTITLLLVTGALITPFLSVQMFHLYYGEELFDSFRYFNILIWLVPLKFTTTTIMTVFFLARQIGHSFSKVYISLAPISIITCFWLVNNYGVNGAIMNILLFELSLLIIITYKAIVNEIKKRYPVTE